MFKKLLIIIPFALSIGAMQATAFSTSAANTAQKQETTKIVLAQHEMSLANRYAVPSVNTVFKDNILLNLAYLSGSVKKPSQIDWDALHKPHSAEFVLQPGEVFAFHEDVLPEFAGKKIKTTNAHFNGAEGFLSDGLLYGDGVCHFASLINWVATDAGLKVVAPVRHDFAVIPGIDRKYGTAIYYDPSAHSVSRQQNLYVENTTDKPVKFIFAYENNALKLTIEK